MELGVIDRIKQGNFSKGQRKIADYILSHEKQAFSMTALELSKKADVSEATVVRFACALGYDGYHQFQKSLAEQTKNHLTAMERMELFSEKKKDHIIKTVLKSDMSKIEHTMSQLDFESFNTAAEALLSAKNIYIAGVRSSAALVTFAEFYFSLLFENCHGITGFGGEDITQKLFHAGSGDVVLGISFPRYSAAMVKALEFARNKGAFVISLTDSNMSPIAFKSSCVLLADSDMDSFTDSLVAPMSVLNALIFAVGYSMKDKTKKIFDELENIWKDYEVYDSNK